MHSNNIFNSLVTVFALSPFAVTWAWILALDPFSAFHLGLLWPRLHIHYFFCVKMCRLPFVFVQSSLAKIHLMWLFGNYCYCILSDVSSFLLKVEWSCMGRWRHIFDDFYPRIRRNFKQNIFFGCVEDFACVTRAFAPLALALMSSKIICTL